MIIGTVENGFLLRRQCCTSALLRVSISVPKRMLFNNANFCEVFGTADHFINFRRQCCTSALLMASTSVPKKCYSIMPTFDYFWALLNFLSSAQKSFWHCWIAFFRQWCTSHQKRRSTTLPPEINWSAVPKISQKLSLLNHSFRQVVLTLNSAEVQHCRRKRKAFSTVPIFIKNWH